MTEQTRTETFFCELQRLGLIAGLMTITIGVSYLRVVLAG